MSLLKFKLEVTKFLISSLSDNRVILNNDEDDNILINPMKRLKYYNMKKNYARIKDMICKSHFSCIEDISRLCKCRFENCESRLKTGFEKCRFISVKIKNNLQRFTM